MLGIYNYDEHSMISYPQTLCTQKRRTCIAHTSFAHGGGLGIRTLAPVTRPNDLANRPLQPLE